MRNRGHDRLIIALTLLLGLAVLGPMPALGQDAAPAADQGEATASIYDHYIFETLLFYGIAAATVVSALALCLTRDIVRMAIWLFVTLAAVAMLYFLLAAPFLGAIQLIVYAGGTLVLLIFGVMLTNKSPWVRFDIKRNEMIAGGVVCLILAAGLIGTLLSTHWPAQTKVETPSVQHLGEELLTTYLVPFEAASVLLLVVMIGAAYLARQERK
jgi:NADH:ubiquinone oxidoreductase subunit 6 (subunit J)